MIICVDDEKTVLNTIKSQLRSILHNQYIIEISDSAEHALEIIDEALEKGIPIPVVIADQLMPGTKGNEFLALVAQKSKKTLTVLLTGQADSEAVGSAVNKAQLYRYISKPWDIIDLQLTIKEAINKYEQDILIESQRHELENYVLRLKEANQHLEQKVAERTLAIARQNAELEIERNKYQILNSTKDKFFNIIAHDLKNPFANIITLSGFYTDNNLTSDDLRNYLQIINKSSEQGYKLLENLLQWARLQTGTIHYNPEFVNCDNFIQEIIDQIRFLGQSKNIEIVHYTNPNFFLYVDVNMFATILRNLLTNAIKYTPRNGNIGIKSLLVNDKIIISVSDTGVGIPPNKIGHLFDITKKNSTNGTENEMGNGLGLILSKEFVEKHNGTIWIESELNKGTTVYMQLPFVKSAV